MSGTINEHEFVVVLRGHSAATFRQGTHIEVDQLQSSVGPVRAVYATRWLSRSDGVVLPGDLWIEVTGIGPSLEESLVPFANAGFAVLPVIALCTNAAVRDPEIELGFESTSGLRERDYFQSYVPPEPETIHIRRHINVEVTLAAIRALGKHPEAERLRRGANQYQIALDSWRLGIESLALAHLWMAAEAITKARIRIECTRRGIGGIGRLASALGVGLDQLDPTVRKNLLLQG